MDSKGGAVRTHYSVLGEEPAVTHDEASAADAFTWDEPLAPIPTRGNPKLSIYGQFATAAATATVDVGLYYKKDDGTFVFMGRAGAVQTLTASAVGHTDGASRHPSTTVIDFDTRGAPYVDVRLISISADDVTLKAWLHASNTRAATAEA